MSEKTSDPSPELVAAGPDSRPSRLPSEHYPPGSLRPIGFVESPDSSQFEATGATLARIAERVSERIPGHRELRVRLCHFRLDPILSPTLFGFHLVPIGNDGEFLDELQAGLELSYAVVVNQSAELQQETVLVFLLQLIYRQRRQAEMQNQGIPTKAIDYEMARQDELALEEIRDVVNPLVYGWSDAANIVRERAREIGFALRVRYEVDPFPRVEEIRARIPLLRRSYNDLDVVRDAIDKVVSLVGGTDPRVGGKVPSEPRNFIQQRMLLMHFRHYLNHAIRDSEVCVTEPRSSVHSL